MIVNVSIFRDTSLINRIYIDPAGQSISVLDLLAIPDDQFNWQSISEFQTKVFRELRQVRIGETVSYSELAQRMGSPRASRAVGQAMASNPFAISVPCHRVVLANGALGNYAWGPSLKSQLIGYERSLI